MSDTSSSNQARLPTSLLSMVNLILYDSSKFRHSKLKPDSCPLHQATLRNQKLRSTSHSNQVFKTAQMFEEPSANNGSSNYLEPDQKQLDLIEMIPEDFFSQVFSSRSSLEIFDPPQQVLDPADFLMPLFYCLYFQMLSLKQERKKSKPKPAKHRHSNVDAAFRSFAKHAVSCAFEVTHGRVGDLCPQKSLLVLNPFYQAVAPKISEKELDFIKKYLPGGKSFVCVKLLVSLPLSVSVWENDDSPICRYNAEDKRQCNVRRLATNKREQKAANKHRNENVGQELMERQIS
jgi:hypothetical protein